MWSLLSLLLSATVDGSVPPLLALTLDDDQRTFEVQLEQHVHVTLQRPTHDPRQAWILLEPPIQQTLHMQRSAEGPDRLDEQPQRWEFVATGPGAQRLRFELRRRGEVKFEAERSYSVLLQVVQ